MIRALLSLVVGGPGGELFTGGVTRPMPATTNQEIVDAWRQEQYLERLTRFYLDHAYPEVAEIEVARRADQGKAELKRLQAYWQRDRKPAADVVAIARSKKTGAR